MHFPDAILTSMRLPLLIAVVLAPAVLLAQPRCLIPGVDPGPVKAEMTPSYAQLSNKSLRVRWERVEGTLGQGMMIDLLTDQREGLGLGTKLFEIKMRSGEQIDSNQMKIVFGPRLEKIRPSSGTPRAAAAISGEAVSAVFRSKSGSLEVEWKAIMLNGSNYIREEATFKPIGGDFDASQIEMVDAECVEPKVTGTVLGSPVASAFYFMGMEHPMARSSANGPSAKCWIERKIPITTESPVTYSAVFGVSSRGEMRRSFLNYVERERAHPYRPFLHYNSWLDISYGAPYTADQCVEALNAFGEELVQKRAVTMVSSLFDDGWDDTKTVWKFNNGFPDGFTPLKETTAKYGFAPGVWLSPWGGYGDARTQRLATGKAEGYEIDRQGFALSGPKYFERFRQVCLDFVSKYGVNQFKFDGTGSPDKHTQGSKFDSDFDAAIQLIHDLRQAKPDLFINLTTGTWPSPFWLRFADSTWRGGYDSNFAGVGTKRQQWITYRDGDTYHGVVEKGSLYPVSSLMLHGIIYASHADGLETDPATISGMRFAVTSGRALNCKSFISRIRC